jgi:hypothetical protein
MLLLRDMLICHGKCEKILSNSDNTVDTLQMQFILIIYHLFSKVCKIYHNIINFPILLIGQIKLRNDGTVLLMHVMSSA